MASKKKDFLAGADSLDKMFSGSEAQEKEEVKFVVEDTPPQEVQDVKFVLKDTQEATQKVRKTKTQAQDQKGSDEPQKLKKKVFSFRAEASEADSWRVWADASGIKVDELGERAIREYIKRHPLKGDQLQIYELKMSQKP